MDREGFVAYLEERSASASQVDASLEIVRGFEALLHQGSTRSLETATRGDVEAFSRQMIATSTNTWDNYIALLRYGKFIGNDDLYIATLELIDGAEALETLHKKLGREVGEAVRDKVFDGIALPPLGTPNRDKPRLTETVVRRLESTIDPATCDRVLGSGLRHLEDGWYASAKERYEEAGGIDAYLAQKAEAFLAELERHREEGTLYFNQPIDDTVIDYVRNHPEIASGVRKGSIVYEAKIPHEAIAYLQTTDKAARAYHYCHCPWVKSSLRDGPSKISSRFCNCSAAFHKKPYEVIFGKPLHAEVLESVLAGDRWCRFALHLPPDAL